MLTLISTLTFISIALLTVALFYPVLSRRDVVSERVAKLIADTEEQPRLVSTPTRWQLLLADIGSRTKIKPTELRTYREMLMAAGYKPDTVYVLLGSKLVLGMALPAVYLMGFALPKMHTTGNGALLMAVACAIGGYLLPTFWLRRKAEERKVEIFHSLPDVLDLLTVCVEAGLSLDAALIKTSENFQQQENPLIQEINTVTQEIRVGKPRSEALKGLGERTMVDDIKGFVAMLVQTEKFGTSLGKTLRTYSDSLRMKRRQLAEERAAKTAIKMLFPLTVCVFPALLVVMLVPAFFKIIAMFSHL